MTVSNLDLDYFLHDLIDEYLNHGLTSHDGATVITVDPIHKYFEEVVNKLIPFIEYDIIDRLDYIVLTRKDNGDDEIVIFEKRNMFRAFPDSPAKFNYKLLSVPIYRYEISTVTVDIGEMDE
ncbi:hypothetical protein TCA2_4483 [Paenibacillus sp. TCA20]|uniref:Uncharacterized protein n=1 Tax=Paenibacillus urinalis TaxID=521520 RepID=A0ABY7XH65_9BACL|nr:MULTISPECIES: hypothetical protein [Paenibacillus]WDI05182.1 hypothetical protein PUW25_25575 [Paenibacillus urinalis]GAK41991.1 hypothetical protein TCA2_4483 [Paenibacillus sp. TCA20]